MPVCARSDWIKDSGRLLGYYLQEAVEEDEELFGDEMWVAVGRTKQAGRSS